MPYKSKAQMRKFFATEAKGELPEGTAREWAHHTPNINKLPAKLGEKTKEGTDLMNAISGLAKQAADDALVVKLANDTQITPDLVRHLAATVKMTPHQFVKAAYDDPAGYTVFLKVASGTIKAAAVPGGAAAGTLMQRLLGAMKSGGNKLNAGANRTLDAVGVKNQTARTGAKIGAGAGAVGGTGLAANSMLSSPKPQPGAPEQPGAHEATVNNQIGGAQAAGMAQGAAAPAATNGPAPNPQQQAGGGGGMSPAGKGLLAAGGVGLGALGVGAMMRKRKQKQVTAADLAIDVMRHAIVKKAADLFRKEAADKFVGYLDTVARTMPIEKQAMVRKLQGAVAEGKPLSHAIKIAYPHLNGEQRGLLAAKLVKAACSVKKAGDKPFFKGKVTGRQESSVKMKDGAVGKMKQMSGSC